MNKRLAIIGAGELGNQIAHLAEQNDELEVVGFFDDTRPIGTCIGKYKVLGTTRDVFTFYELKYFDCLMIGIGYHHMNSRKAFFEMFLPFIPFSAIIHPSCIIDPTAKIGTGVVLYPGCVIDKNVVIEDNVLLNLNVVVSHNSQIASHSFLSPRVTIAGFTFIGECCNLGVNTTIIDNIKITDHVQTGGGSLVIKDILLSGLYYGNPVKFIR